MKRLFPLLFFFTVSALNAQNFINENSVFECDQAFDIQLPLQLQNNPTVFYQYEEQFSFWYRLTATTEETATIRLNPIDSNDRYVVLVFEFKAGDFCRQLFNGEQKPLKLNINQEEEQSELSLPIQTGKSYFLCVLNTSFSNCGHELSIHYQDKKTRIKAIHIPCVIPEEEEEVKKEPEELLVIQNRMSSFVKLINQNNPDQSIKAEVNIIDPQYKTSVKLDFSKTNTLPLIIEKGKKYRVSCIAPGYKRFEHELIISDYMQGDSSNFNVFLEPLEKGDKFLMSHIYFHPNTYALKKEANKELSYLVNFLKNNPELKIELAGHTNGNNKIKRNKAYKKRGEQWNFKGTSKKLSVLRAEEIKRKLVQKRIEESRISTVGYGGDHMLIENARTLEAIEKNVRVEVKIY